MRYVNDIAPIHQAMSRAFRPDPAAWRDVAEAAPTPGELLRDAGLVIGSMLALALLATLLVALLPQA